MAEEPTPSVSPVFRVTVPVFAAVVLSALLLALFPSDEEMQWVFHPAAVAGFAWAGQLWYVARSLTAPVVGSAWGQLVGLANALTMARGGLYAVVVGFVVVSPETSLAWVPALCYGTGVVLDRLDGLVARTVGEETRLGERLDMAFDTFGFVAAPLVAVAWGQLPVWYLSLSAARYVYRGALSWRRCRGRRVYDRPDSDVGRYFAGVQMVFVTLALAPAVPASPIRTAAPFVLAPSLAVFARDYLVASGRLPTAED